MLTRLLLYHVLHNKIKASCVPQKKELYFTRACETLNRHKECNQISYEYTQH